LFFDNSHLRCAARRRVALTRRGLASRADWIAALLGRNTIFRSEPRSQAATKAAVAQGNDF
jgi:hypothetical protein